MKKPLIAIAGVLFKDFRIEFLGEDYIKVNNNYSKAIINAGGIPIILPPINDINIISQQLSLCNGLLLPGGSDINPIIYKESPMPLLEFSDESVDLYHINLVKKAIEFNMPILGICRGCQILNIAFGGTLYQDISYATSLPILHRQSTPLSQRCHSISIKDNSILNEVFGDNYVVNSAHHQCIKALAPNFQQTAISDDGIIEAIEMSEKTFVVGVQWHPEAMAINDNTTLNLFKKFINSNRYSNYKNNVFI